jgi:hypothetical protein
LRTDRIPSVSGDSNNMATRPMPGVGQKQN